MPIIGGEKAGVLAMRRLSICASRAVASFILVMREAEAFILKWLNGLTIQRCTG
ncbi:hypothetical protein [Novosphingobium rosa]|uniref:hypothetical protein n=1 Tax=Novosphingobium rosa TaxID=76978 RepID=UPI0012EDA380|nr:hypothetical protein [Novosphingobium rosa]